MFNTDIDTTTLNTLRMEAGMAGDLDAVALCDAALTGDEDAMDAVAEMLDAAAAQDDSDDEVGW